ncbi:MAG TPA: nitrogen fixation protein NifQ [Burkholderiaceae bacterium]|nr:nitrogen fixation protein NifQ [Burkholderiaceae bacterium]
MERPLIEYLQRRFGTQQMLRIVQRWHANFGLAEGQIARAGDRHQEYDDLVALLGEYARDRSEEIAAVARWLAFSCTGENHLWEDLGLPERPALTSLMQDCFPQLRALNCQNMRWKKFFYKQLCNRAQVFACQAPSCDQCSEFSLCFESSDPQGSSWEFPRALILRVQRDAPKLPS